MFRLKWITCNKYSQFTQASVVGYDELFFSSEFVNALRILPRSYETGDGYYDFVDFWNNFGTHLLLTAEFGGSIRGSVVSDKCSVFEGFSQSKEYEVCLNGAYKGVELEGCQGRGKSETTAQTVASSIKSTQITVRGGDSTHFSDIFKNFGDKENDFGDWISGLNGLPYVVGGNTNEIHDVIRAAVNLGNHQLGAQLSDEEILNIAAAMKAAFKDYAADAGSEDVSFAGECSAQCVNGLLNEAACVCEECKDNCCLTDNAMKHGTNFI